MSSRAPDESPSESSAPVPALDLASAGASPGCLKAAWRSASRKHQPSDHSTPGACSLVCMTDAVQHAHTHGSSTHMTQVPVKRRSPCACNAAKTVSCHAHCTQLGRRQTVAVKSHSRKACGCNLHTGHWGEHPPSEPTAVGRCLLLCATFHRSCPTMASDSSVPSV